MQSLNKKLGKAENLLVLSMFLYIVLSHLLLQRGNVVYISCFSIPRTGILAYGKYDCESVLCTLVHCTYDPFQKRIMQRPFKYKGISSTVADENKHTVKRSENYDFQNIVTVTILKNKKIAVLLLLIWYEHLSA